MSFRSIEKFTEGLKDKSTLVETRVGEVENWCFECVIVVEEEIEIDRPRAEADGRSFAEVLFDALELCEHFIR